MVRMSHLISYDRALHNPSNSSSLQRMQWHIRLLPQVEITHLWQRIIIYSLNRLPVGQHTIELEVIRVPTVSTQPVEHPIAKWDIKVVP